ncbi:hypothetical protein IE53DRAFT_384496 [Violaceomyces palustris]|uniref:Uncharacterized protein n=1 Tax=Violaceomyces palustris TaxID=1673888 RepID=A0ACD0P4M9_9BASI|nr:hypothetical protein IE53DRAFT_384496 [Violaceomyces palustris]
MSSTLFQVQSLFYQGAYPGCIQLALESSSNLSLHQPESIDVLLYAARSHLSTSPVDPSACLQLLSNLPPQSSSSPHVQSVRSLARFLAANLQADQTGMANEIVNLTELLDSAVVGETKGQTIRCCAATAMFIDGDSEGALETLGVGDGTSREIECVALGVHILLSINRPDLAQKEYLAARTWAEDSLLIQLIEAWLGLAKGGRASQQAYYVYDELAQNPSNSGSANIVNSMVGKAIAMASNGDYKGAKKELEEAGKLDPRNAHVLANKAALANHFTTTTSQDPAADYLEDLRSLAPHHPLLVELDSLERTFDQVANRLETVQASS